MTGCKTPCIISGASHEQSRDSVRTEYKHDSVYIYRWHTQYQKGDTIFIRDSVWRDRWHELKVRDSVYLDRTDTIVQTITIKEKGFLYRSGIALWVLIALLVAGVIVGLIIKFAK